MRPFDGSMPQFTVDELERIEARHAMHQVIRDLAPVERLARRVRGYYGISAGRFPAIRSLLLPSAVRDIAVQTERRLRDVGTQTDQAVRSSGGVDPPMSSAEEQGSSRAEAAAGQ